MTLIIVITSIFLIVAVIVITIVIGILLTSMISSTIGTTATSLNIACSCRVWAVWRQDPPVEDILNPKTLTKDPTLRECPCACGLMATRLRCSRRKTLRSGNTVLLYISMHAELRQLCCKAAILARFRNAFGSRQAHGEIVSSRGAASPSSIHA